MMKRPVLHLPVAVSAAPLTRVSSQIGTKPPGIGADASDAALLAALDAPAFLGAARSRAHDAYQAARVRSDNPAAPFDWQVLDGRWQAMMRDLNVARRTVESENTPNTAAGQAARAAEVRALLAAAEYFESYAPPKALKPVAAMPGVVFAHHSAGGGEHFLETHDREGREREIVTLQEGAGA